MPILSAIAGVSGRNYGARLTPKILIDVLIPVKSFYTNVSDPFTPVVASKGLGNFVYTISPSLPSGLSINSSTGEITGVTYSEIAATTYTVTATDRRGSRASGNFSLTVLLGVPTTVSMLLVGGGGGGVQGDNTNCGGGGGGAGGVFYSTASIMGNTPYSISIGGGGSGASNEIGQAGVNSTAFSKIALGGGAGGINRTRATTGALSGGSGGGTARADRVGGAGLQPTSASGGYGNNGGNGVEGPDAGGAGGGGAGAGGGDGSYGGGGGGGDGTIVASAVLATVGAGVLSGGSYYIAAGGGGGGSSVEHPGNYGGTGGGGRGGTLGPGGTNGIGTNGSANTGSGGGGGSRLGSPQYRGGNGGSGMAVVIVPDGYPLATTSTTNIYAPGDGYRYYKFLTTGSITFVPPV